MLHCPPLQTIAFRCGGVSLAGHPRKPAPRRFGSGIRQWARQWMQRHASPWSGPGVSLKRKLLLWLLLPQLVLWLSGGFLAWRIALQNGEKGIDQTLTQSVRALARQIKPIGDGLLVDFPKAAQDILEQDPADRITYMVSSPPGGFCWAMRSCRRRRR
jgi:hypothetical protein